MPPFKFVKIARPGDVKRLLYIASSVYLFKFHTAMRHVSHAADVTAVAIIVFFSRECRR